MGLFNLNNKKKINEVYLKFREEAGKMIKDAEKENKELNFNIFSFTVCEKENGVELSSLISGDARAMTKAMVNMSISDESFKQVILKTAFAIFENEKGNSMKEMKLTKKEKNNDPFNFMDEEERKNLGDVDLDKFSGDIDDIGE